MLPEQMSQSAPEGSLVALLLHDGVKFTNGMDSGVPCIDPTRFYMPAPVDRTKGGHDLIVVGFIKKYDENGALMTSTADPLNPQNIVPERDQDNGRLNMWYVQPKAVKTLKLLSDYRSFSQA